MSEPLPPTFLVSAYSDPVVVQIHGKANYLNCNSFREFIAEMVSAGKPHIVLDFENCKGMDSTFLGILAGTAMEMRRQSPPGVLIICKLGERNHELVCNLGLQNLLTIGEDLPDNSDAAAEFSALKNIEVSAAKNVLNAHENLVKADTENAAKFQDVIAFLRNQVEKQEQD
ncbi:MAG: STAS domain-containing protein [Opitutae bacterium]|jgi:anti-anti-sigma factor|nr:STAS domain-containing protein [Opitutae bacterium]MDG1301023.1 STAS domain-containing protein [Opitutae bacterium]